MSPAEAASVSDVSGLLFLRNSGLADFDDGVFASVGRQHYVCLAGLVGRVCLGNDFDAVCDIRIYRGCLPYCTPFSMGISLEDGVGLGSHGNAFFAALGTELNRGLGQSRRFVFAIESFVVFQQQPDDFAVFVCGDAVDKKSEKSATIIIGDKAVFV